MEIKIKYFSKDYPRLEKTNKGDWIDLRVDSLIRLDTANEVLIGGTYEKIRYKKGNILKLGLGIAMELPEGYEAEVRVRSSTFKNWGLIQTNGTGVIDNSYCGDNDEWLIELIATRDGVIERFDRICQFRIRKNQPDFILKEVDVLGNEDRGGYGSTGRK